MLIRSGEQNIFRIKGQWSAFYQCNEDNFSFNKLFAKYKLTSKHLQNLLIDSFSLIPFFAYPSCLKVWQKLKQKVVFLAVLRIRIRIRWILKILASSIRIRIQGLKYQPKTAKKKLLLSKLKSELLKKEIIKIS